MNGDDNQEGQPYDGDEVDQDQSSRNNGARNPLTEDRNSIIQQQLLGLVPAPSNATQQYATAVMPSGSGNSAYSSSALEFMLQQHRAAIPAATPTSSILNPFLNAHIQRSLLLQLQERQLRETQARVIRQIQLDQLLSRVASSNPTGSGQPLHSQMLGSQTGAVGTSAFSQQFTLPGRSDAGSLLNSSKPSPQGSLPNALGGTSSVASLPPAQEEDKEMTDGEYYSLFGFDEGEAAVNETFPHKLYRMLYEVQAKGREDILSFFPHGNSFAVHKPRDFVAQIMPKYFSTARLASFQRQLNLYGFQRIEEGREKGGYQHEYFRQGQRTLCNKIRRQKVKGLKSDKPAGEQIPTQGSSAEALTGPGQLVGAAAIAPPAPLMSSRMGPAALVGGEGRGAGISEYSVRPPLGAASAAPPCNSRTQQTQRQQEVAAQILQRLMRTQDEDTQSNEDSGC